MTLILAGITRALIPLEVLRHRTRKSSSTNVWESTVTYVYIAFALYEQTESKNNTS